MSGRAAARLGDLGLDRKRKNTAPAIHGSKNVFINGREAVRVGDAYAPPVGGQLASGSPTVFINGRQAGRIGDDIAGATIDTTGSPNVFIGDSSPVGSRKPFREKCEECAPSAADVPVPAEKPEPVEEEKTSCDLITAEKLKTVWPNASDEKLQAVAEELNYSINIGKIDTHSRLVHFLGQIKHESGSTLRFKEDLHYKTAQGLANTFSAFSSTGKRGGAPNQAAKDVYNLKTWPERYAAIGNGAYGSRKDLGNTQEGDGYKFRGRGLIQVTGRDNYDKFNTRYSTLWGAEMVAGEDGELKAIDFVENPELLEETKYAVRASLDFWLRKKLWEKADEDVEEVTETTANKISTVINSKDTKTFATRWGHVKKLYDAKTFENICFNTAEDLSNKQAKEPKKKKNEESEGGNRKSDD